MRISDWSSDVCSPDLVELRLLRDDADDAGRGILAEQGRLRAAQHLDPLDVRQVADLGGRARAINAVDADADRGLDAGAVGAVPEAADDEIGVGARLELADTQAGNRGLQGDQAADL